MFIDIRIYMYMLMVKVYTRVWVQIGAMTKEENSELARKKEKPVHHTSALPCSTSMSLIVYRDS